MSDYRNEAAKKRKHLVYDNYRLAWLAISIQLHRGAWTALICRPSSPGGFYKYRASVEPEIVRAMGAIYGPYTKTYFQSMRQTDIEHIVAVSDAHDC